MSTVLTHLLRRANTHCLTTFQFPCDILLNEITDIHGSRHSGRAIPGHSGSRF